LLVDDEEMVRRTGRRLLERIGYRIILAADGKEALETYNNYRDEISVVIVDFSMPDMDGKEVFLRLKDMDPSVRVIICSGFGRETLPEEWQTEDLAGFIQKPFSLEQLSTELSNALK